MQVALRKLCLYVEKNKFLNRLDQAFSFMCAHISQDLLFHLEGLRTPKEAWENLEYFFGKQDELRGHILNNKVIALVHGLSVSNPFNNYSQSISL